MKANPVARKVLRIRIVMATVVVSAVLVADVVLGGSLVARFGKAVPPQPDVVQVPNVSLGDVLASMR